MRKRNGWLAVLVVLGVALTPQASNAQLPPEGTGGLDVVPPTGVYWPFGRQRLEQGGFYAAGEFLYMRQTNPLRSEALAFRGFVDEDGSIGPTIGIPSFPGNFIGSRASALDVNEVTGPNNFQPGFNLTVGYRFENGLAVEMKWIHLDDVKIAATAGILPNSPIGLSGQETFLTSPVYNFTPAYFGPGNTFFNAAGTQLGSPLGIVGIWDASSQQEIYFIQRFDQWEMTFRVPIQDTECWRTYTLVGPRLVSMWERFTWITVHPEADGSVQPIDSATYSNVSSNRLYGAHIGIGNEFELGDTPAGAFSLTVDLDSALFLDLFKGRPKYELGDRSTAAQRGRDLAAFVPELDGQVNLWYYPYHGIVCRVGYNVMAFFNTYSSPKPVDFNFGTITPAYESTFRLLDGFNLGVGFTW